MTSPSQSFFFFKQKTYCFEALQVELGVPSFLEREGKCEDSVFNTICIAGAML